MYVSRWKLDREVFQHEFEEMRRMMDEGVRKNLKLAKIRISPNVKPSAIMENFRKTFGNIPF
jgi:hypothetical protein